MTASPTKTSQPTEQDIFAAWQRPESTRERLTAGKRLREKLPVRAQADLRVSPDRDPFGILTAQNRSRLQHLIPLRTERMSRNPFTFYRGTAAIMAADLAQAPSTGLHVPSCGDAHISNFGFYATPQRTLTFDLNDFDEAAWAPWEWDLKRLVTSIVIAGRAGSRDDDSIRAAALGAVRAYAVALRAAAESSPVKRYFTHFDPEAGLDQWGQESQAVLLSAIAHARKRTGDRATKKLTESTADGRLVFSDAAPTMTRLEPEVEEIARDYLRRYLANASADVRQLMLHYRLSDAARRVVGVGSVGTRCSLALLQDGDGNTLIMQSKEAGRSVLEQYGGIEQPHALQVHVAQHGEGARVVALQRMLQATSDPFLGHLRGNDGVDFYVRQFHDMKGGIDAESLDDEPFANYAQACSVLLARAHSQAQDAALVSGYAGNGKALGEAILEWSIAYAELSRHDYQVFCTTQR